jgi:hypothetical protein
MAYKKKRSKECKILWIKKNSIAVDFMGCGFEILINKEIDQNLKTINVFYGSELGTKDFKLSI